MKSNLTRPGPAQPGQKSFSDANISVTKQDISMKFYI